MALNVAACTASIGIDLWRGAIAVTVCIRKIPAASLRAVIQFGSPIVRQRRLATELRRLREHLGLTGDEVAKDLGWSPSRVSRYELARARPKAADLMKLFDRYGVGNGDCVEFAQLRTGHVAVRDSKCTPGPVLLFTPREWRTFVGGVKRGAFDQFG